MGKIRGEKRLVHGPMTFLPPARNCLTSTSQTKHPAFDSNKGKLISIIYYYYY